MDDQVIVEESKEKQSIDKLGEAKKSIKNFFAKPWVHVGIGVAAGLIVKPVVAAAKQFMLELLGTEPDEAEPNSGDEQEEMPF